MEEEGSGQAHLFPKSHSFFSFFFFLFFFLGPQLRHMEVPGLGSNCGWSCWPRPQPQQGLIGTASATYAAACGNSRFLTP